MQYLSLALDSLLHATDASGDWSDDERETVGALADAIDILTEQFSAETAEQVA
jgi:hypothetical protein